MQCWIQPDGVKRTSGVQRQILMRDLVQRIVLSQKFWKIKRSQRMPKRERQINGNRERKGQKWEGLVSHLSACAPQSPLTASLAPAGLVGRFSWHERQVLLWAYQGSRTHAPGAGSVLLENQRWFMESDLLKEPSNIIYLWTLHCV